MPQPVEELIGVLYWQNLITLLLLYGDSSGGGTRLRGEGGGLNWGGARSSSFARRFGKRWA